MPHFEGTLAINEAAWKHLIANKGAVDKMFGGSINTSRKLAVAGVQTARATDLLLPKTFAQRGVADPSVLPDYPYRDDALLHWDAIHRWVCDYLQLYYRSEADLLEDEELCRWGQELAAQDGGPSTACPTTGSSTPLPNGGRGRAHHLHMQRATRRGHFPQYRIDDLRATHAARIVSARADKQDRSDRGRLYGHAPAA